MQLMMPEDEQL